MQPILISACLLGRPVRYDGSGKKLDNALVATWQAQGRLVPLCPEQIAGFATPRPPSEISHSAGAEAVLDGVGRIMEASGSDVTDLFVNGARAVLQIARENNCKFALLTDGSPSCGSRFIYDGTFSGTKIAGAGVVAALLRRNGIVVYSETEIAALADALS